ncbi:hypothetical protein C8Q76DRAFT_788958 [Earliella scabrosa]|nr:hypothetical protein C8Q76DRAFT_788958 [Earliella scabrosa]
MSSPAPTRSVLTTTWLSKLSLDDLRDLLRVWVHPRKLPELNLWVGKDTTKYVLLVARKHITACWSRVSHWSNPAHCPAYGTLNHREHRVDHFLAMLVRQGRLEVPLDASMLSSALVVRDKRRHAVLSRTVSSSHRTSTALVVRPKLAAVPTDRRTRADAFLQAFRARRIGASPPRDAAERLAMVPYTPCALAVPTFKEVGDIEYVDLRDDFAQASAFVVGMPSREPGPPALTEHGSPPAVESASPGGATSKSAGEHHCPVSEHISPRSPHHPADDNEESPPVRRPRNARARARRAVLSSSEEDARNSEDIAVGVRTSQNPVSPGWTPPGEDAGDGLANNTAVNEMSDAHFKDEHFERLRRAMDLVDFGQHAYLDSDDERRTNLNEGWIRVVALGTDRRPREGRVSAADDRLWDILDDMKACYHFDEARMTVKAGNLVEALLSGDELRDAVNIRVSVGNAMKGQSFYRSVVFVDIDGTLNVLRPDDDLELEPLDENELPLGVRDAYFSWDFRVNPNPNQPPLRRPRDEEVQHGSVPNVIAAPTHSVGGGAAGRKYTQDERDRAILAWIRQQGGGIFAEGGILDKIRAWNGKKPRRVKVLVRWAKVIYAVVSLQQTNENADPAGAHCHITLEHIHQLCGRAADWIRQACKVRKYIVRYRDHEALNRRIAKYYRLHRRMGMLRLQTTMEIILGIHRKYTMDDLDSSDDDVAQYPWEVIAGTLDSSADDQDDAVDEEDDEEEEEEGTLDEEEPFGYQDYGDTGERDGEPIDIFDPAYDYDADEEEEWAGDAEEWEGITSE